MTVRTTLPQLDLAMFTAEELKAAQLISDAAMNVGRIFTPEEFRALPKDVVERGTNVRKSYKVYLSGSGIDVVDKVRTVFTENDFLESFKSIEKGRSIFKKLKENKLTIYPQARSTPRRLPALPRFPGFEKFTLPGIEHSLPYLFSASTTSDILEFLRDKPELGQDENGQYIIGHLRQGDAPNTFQFEGKYRTGGKVRITLNDGNINGIANADAAMTVEKTTEQPLSPFGIGDLGDRSHYGGIDFNAANLNLQIKRDGKGVPLPISQQNLENIHIDGLVPVILDIRPAVASSLLSELQGNSS